MADSAKRSFYDFQVAMLKRGLVKEKNIEKILSEENMKELKKAFTHSSHDPDNNLEMYEFLGDSTVNEFVAYYIKKRFPKIVSVKWLTRIKHNLVSKKQLAVFCRREGLEDHILCSDEIRALKSKLPKDIRDYRSAKGKNKDYVSVLEDVMEAYMGCLVTIITNSGNQHGTAVQVCHNILESFFDAEKISIKYEDVFDAVSRLKELYESKRRGFRWPNDQAYVVTKIKDESFKAQVYGWPLDDRKPEEKNKTLLAEEFGTDGEEAKQKAATKALLVLDSVYNIPENTSDAYEK